MKTSAANLGQHLFRRKRERDLATLVAEGRAPLKQCLTAFDLTFIGVGNIVGGGIFILLGLAVKTAGPAIVLSFVLAGFSSICSALCYSEFASRLPVAGTAYAFTYLEAGELPAWMIGWALVLEFVVGAAAIAVGWSHYAYAFVRGIGFSMPGYWLNVSVGLGSGSLNPLALAFLLSLTALVVLGISESKMLNHAVTAVKLGALVLIIILGTSRADSSHWVDFAPHGTGGVLQGAALVMFAYIGFDICCSVAEEALDPEWTLPVGIVGSVCITTVLYIAVAAVVTLMVPWGEVDLNAPLAMAFAESPFPWMVPVISVAAVLGLVAIGLGAVLAAPRLLMTMARDGLLPQALGHVHKEWQTPVIASLVCGVCAAGFTFFFSYEMLSQMVSFGTMAALTMVCVDLLLARKFDADAPSAWRVPAAVVIFVAAVVVASLAWSRGAPLLTGVGTLFGTGAAVAVLALPETYRPKDTFVTPQGPLVALLGVFCNLLMMCTLEGAAEVVLLWWAVGMVIYCGYGMWNSRLIEERQCLAEPCTPL